MQEQLVRKAKQGDREAFSQLYAAISKKMYSTAYYLLGRKEDAEDLVMDTVLDAFQSIVKLRNEEAFEDWIMRILINKGRKIRKKYIQEELPLENELISNPEVENDEHIILHSLLESLNQVDRMILILGIVDGYTSNEIGDILQLNPNTVRSRQRRSLEKIREKLTGKGVSNGRKRSD